MESNVTNLSNLYVLFVLPWIDKMQLDNYIDVKTRDMIHAMWVEQIRQHLQVYMIWIYVILARLMKLLEVLISFRNFHTLPVWICWILHGERNRCWRKHGLICKLSTSSSCASWPGFCQKMKKWTTSIRSGPVYFFWATDLGNFLKKLPLIQHVWLALVNVDQQVLRN